AALESFIATASRSGLTRFVLTTREYLLNQAKQAYEKLTHSPIDRSKCTVTLASYSKVQRGRILYNHIYFARLPRAHRERLLADPAYCRKIDHPNYSPRIIDWMTDPRRNVIGSPGQYVDDFLQNLSRPTRLWAHAFEHQLSANAQAVLLALAVLGGVVPHD